MFLEIRFKLLYEFNLQLLDLLPFMFFLIIFVLIIVLIPEHKKVKHQVGQVHERRHGGKGHEAMFTKIRL